MELWESLQRLGSAEMAEIGLLPFFVAMAISLASALFIAYLYQVFYRARATGSRVHHAFPLIGVAVTAIFVTVQFSLPLSLGLLGALSIVRFRTPIKEPEEIGFILLVIASALCTATFNIGFLAVLLFMAVVALLCLKAKAPFLWRREGDGILLVTAPATTDDVTLQDLLQSLTKTLPRGAITAVTDNEDKLAVTASFIGLSPDRVPEVRSLVKGIIPGASASVVFHHAGDV